MPSQCKRKRKTLTLLQKNNIEKGDKLVNLSNEYGVGCARYITFKKEKKNIKNRQAYSS